jgi:hypothetical protein
VRFIVFRSRLREFELVGFDFGAPQIADFVAPASGQKQ